MKILPLLVWMAFGLFAVAQERTWKSNDGKELVGELVRELDQALVLNIKGKEFTVPLSRLSEEDRAWLEEQKKARLEKEKEFAVLAGTNKTFTQSADQPVTFHVYYPTAIAKGKPLPMLILFSAHGQSRGLLDQFKESCETVGWIGVGCDTFRNGVDNSILDPLFGELLPIIEKSVPHNPQRLYMGGISGGAMRALQLSARFDRPWKGIISCGGWLGKEYDLDYRKNMAVAWVNGDKDNGANSWVDGDSSVLQKRGCKTKLFQFPGGHVVGPPASLTEAMRWVGENTKD